MFKYIYFSDKDIEESIVDLRKKFNSPGKEFFFKSGKYKGNDVIFVLNDLTTRTYGEPVESKQHKGCLFFPPTEDTQIELDDFEVHKQKRDLKIPIDLSNGKTIYIIPATLEPKRVIFDLDEVVEETNPYSTATEYGRLAYSLFNEAKTNTDIPLNNPTVKKLVMLSLLKSYSLPLDLINWLGFISVQDFDNLITAAMGISEELQKKSIGGS